MAAAVTGADATETSIEALFRPSTRYRDSRRNRRGRFPASITELALLPNLMVGKGSGVGSYMG
jgi:hypothetical protein